MATARARNNVANRVVFMWAGSFRFSLVRRLPDSIGNRRWRADLHFDVKLNVVDVLDPKCTLTPQTENDVVAEERPAAHRIHGYLSGANRRGNANGGAEERFAHET